MKNARHASDNKKNGTQKKIEKQSQYITCMSNKSAQFIKCLQNPHP